MALSCCQFEENGAMSKLQVCVSQLPAKLVIVVDTTVMVWTLHWPSRGKAKVHDLINSMNRTVG